jgi:hypothetical protein
MNVGPPGAEWGRVGYWVVDLILGIVTDTPVMMNGRRSGPAHFAGTPSPTADRSA